MVASAFTAPHVTEFLQVDVTETMAAVRRARELPEFAGVKVSPLLFVAKALLVAVRRHPMINSSWDEAAQEIVVKRPVNLGIAVAAERGLLVPNVKGADALALADLARALDALASTARAGKATPEDLAGGTITITNVGVFGVDAGTPILLPGEAGNPGLRTGARPTMGGGWRARRAEGDDPLALVRPSDRRRGTRLGRAPRRRLDAGGPGPDARLVVAARRGS